MVGFIYLLKSNFSLKKQLESIQDDMDLTTALYEINDEKYKRGKRIQGLKTKDKADNADKYQLSLDFFCSN